MAKNLTVATKFTAVDRFSQTVQKMTTSVNQFSGKAVAAFHRVEKAERRIRKGISGLLGKLGQLGLAFGGLAIATMVATANVELEENLASLSAITGVTGNAFKAFEQQIEKVSKSQRVFTGDTAKAFEIVGSAKPELLSNAEALGTVTDAVITLSKASKDDLQTSALNLTGAMNQFNLAADQSMRVINTLAAASQAGSANISKINESLTVFGAVANAANISLEESVGLIETLGTKSLFGAEAGTALRGTILRLQAAGLGYKSGVFNINDALEEARKKSQSFGKAIERDAWMQKVFGQRNIVTGQILLDNIDKFNGFTKAVTGTNVAVQQANINSDTLKMKWKEVTDAFKNATTSTDLQSKQMRKLKDILSFVAGNMDKIVGVALNLIKVFAIYKTVMAAVNIVMGITNVIAAANPFVLIALAVIGLISGIVYLIKHWSDLVNWIKTSDNWFAKLIRGALKPIIWIINGIRDAWIRVKEAFATGGFFGAIKSIGKSILSFILAPVEAVLMAVNKLSGGKWAGETLSKISKFRAELTASPENGAPVEGETGLNPDQAIENVRTERIEKTKNEKVSIEVSAAQGSNARILEDESNLVKTTPTLGWSNG